jgi:hypothetical protein
MLSTLVGLNGKNLLVEEALNKLLKIVKVLEDIRFIFSK